MSDDESDGQQPSALDAIRIAEIWLGQLKSEIYDAGGDKLLVASILQKGGSQMKNVGDFFLDRSRETEEEVSNQLFALLDNHERWPRAMFWSHFTKKLKGLGKTSAEFRRDCLSRSSDENDSKVIHEVCKLNPPASVVKTLIDITPVIEEGRFSSQLNHMACVYREIASGYGSEYEDSICYREYPLHMVMRHGGSLELVKLLVTSDVEGETLTWGSGLHRNYSSVFHVLVANKSNHDPAVFSLILRYLVMTGHTGALLRESQAEDNKTPVGLLWQSLKNDNILDTDILRDDDFIFLLKATCHAYESKRSPGHPDCKSNGKGLNQEINNIPLVRAYLVCSPCFRKKDVAKVLEHFQSVDRSFLLGKDEHGKFPIHHAVGNRIYFINSVANNKYCANDFKQFIVETILKIAPQCAQQADEKGRLPLHIAADTQRVEMIYDTQRLALVRTIWKAYPSAENQLDKETSLPIFALSMRGEDKTGRSGYSRSSYYDDEYSGLSSAFFLLRQSPGILAEAMSFSGNHDASPGALESPTKRRRIVTPTKK